MLTCSAASMVRRWQSAGPHRCVRRVLLWGVKVWRSITLIIPVGMRRTATKDINDRQIDRPAAGEEPARGAGGLPRRGLRGAGAHEHLLQPARDWRAGEPAHTVHRARGCAVAVRLWYGARACGVPRTHQDFRRGSAHGAV